MPVQMAGQTRSRCLAKVKSDVESIRFEGFLKLPHGLDQALSKLCVLLATQLVQTAAMAGRGDEEVAIVIGVTVENCDCHLASMHYLSPAVVGISNATA